MTPQTPPADAGRDPVPAGVNPSSIPDGQRCINCKVDAKRGVITHAVLCPEWRRPKIGGPR